VTRGMSPWEAATQIFHFLGPVEQGDRRLLLLTGMAYCQTKLVTTLNFISVIFKSATLLAPNPEVSVKSI
jgi:hypothetical protein